jgi:hypothetical protein
MAITKRAKSRAEEFVQAAPDAQPQRAMRGKKRQLVMTLPPDLIEAVDVVAAEEERSRAKMIELLLRGALEGRTRKAAA